MLRIPASGSAAPVTQIVAVTIITTSFAEFMPRNYCETTDRTIRLFSVSLLPDDIEARMTTAPSPKTAKALTRIWNEQSQVF
jgi:hypothetical protein